MARQRRMGATAREQERYFGDVGCVGADIPVDSCAGARRVASQALLDLHAEARAFRPDHAAMARMRLPVDQQLKLGGMPNVLTKLRPAPRVLRSETVRGFSWLKPIAGHRRRLVDCRGSRLRSIIVRPKSSGCVRSTFQQRREIKIHRSSVVKYGGSRGAAINGDVQYSWGAVCAISRPVRAHRSG